MSFPSRYSWSAMTAAFVVLVSLLTTGCASVPSRFVQNPGTFSYEVSLSGAYLDQFEGLDSFPVPANLALGVKYGVVEGLDTGLRFYPLPMFLGVVVLEPSLTGNFWKPFQNFRMNYGLSVPTELNTKLGTVNLQPRVDLTGIKDWDRTSAYGNAEVQGNLEELLGGDRWYHFAIQTGARYAAVPGWAGEAEVGLVRIGEYSQASPLARLEIGVPTIALGTGYSTDH